MFLLFLGLNVKVRLSGMLDDQRTKRRAGGKGYKVVEATSRQSEARDPLCHDAERVYDDLIMGRCTTSSITKYLCILATLAVVVLLSGCGRRGPAASRTAPDGGTGVGGMSRLRVSVHDQPAPSVDHLLVTIEKIEIHSDAGGWVTLRDRPIRFDLLTLRDGNVLRLLNVALAAGTYQQLRLVIGPDTFATRGGMRVEVKTPSAEESGIKIIGPFTLPADRCADIVLDFDPSQSLRENPRHGFILQPVIRVESVQDVPCGPPPGAGVPTNTPEEAYDDFVAAWESGDADRILSSLDSEVRDMYREPVAQISVADRQRVGAELRRRAFVRNIEHAGRATLTILDGNVPPGQPLRASDVILTVDGDQWKVYAY